MSAAERKSLSSVPSSSGLSTPKPSQDSSRHSRKESEDTEPPRTPKQFDPSKLTLLPSELRVIKRLSQRVNVLPVIGCADSLTDDRLSAIKEAIRSELVATGLDFGVFGPPKFDQDPAQNGHSIHFNLPKANARQDTAQDTEDVEEEEEERKSRGVIRLKISRFSTAQRSRSRTRRDAALSYTGDGEGTQNGIHPPEEDSVANIRFSASHFQKMDLSDILPFALISPETIPERVVSKPSRRHTMHSQVTTNTERDVSGSDYGEDESPQATSPVNGDGYGQSNLPYLDGPPADLRGVFVRKFRWGKIDVLDPNHCDFAALRTAVLSTHMMVRSSTSLPLVNNLKLSFPDAEGEDEGSFVREVPNGEVARKACHEEYHRRRQEKTVGR